MIRVFLILTVVMAMGSISGCGGVFGDAVRHVRTPDAEICQKTMGLTKDDAEENLDMGKAVSVITKKTGDQTRIYTKGNLKAELTFDQAGKVIESTCKPIERK